MNRLFKLSMQKYLFITLLFFSCINRESNKSIQIERIEANNYVTWENSCFDRCASIWLMKNFVDSTATFNFIEFGKKVTDGIPFDVPGAELGRQKNISCFESIIIKYKLENPSLTEMAKVIHDIDVNKWGVKITKDADSLESVFNKLRAQIKIDMELVDKSEDLFWDMYNNYGQ